MRKNAYILAADPAWIEASVLSYYDIVDRIVVSYDQDGLGWTGVPIDVEQCLKRLRAIDRNGKFDYRPGHFARPAHFDRPMENDTYQRQVALDQASDGADWVLQLDTDEVLGDCQAFCLALGAAHASGRSALNYPSIWLYNHARGRWYMEISRRGWRRAASFPGPLAVAAGTIVYEARRVARTPERYYHCDINRNPSSLAHPNHISVDRVIAIGQAVFHFSWVRSEQWLRAKFNTWSHARDKDWNPEIALWLSARDRPWLTSITSHIRGGKQRRRFRVVRIPQRVHELVALSGIEFSEVECTGAGT